MTKVFVVFASILASLGLAGFLPDEPTPLEAPRPPSPPADVVKKVQVRALATVENDDPADILRDAYERLSKLRAERPALEGRPMELLERATDLYRQAIEAYNGSGDYHLVAARGLAIASRELAQAVERLRGVMRQDRPDPDLPPPPPARREDRGLRVEIFEEPSLWIPPPLGVDGAPVPPVPPVPPGPPRGDRGEVETFVFNPPGGWLLRGEDGKGIRKFDARVNPDQMRAFQERLRAMNELVEKQARQRMEQAQAQAAGPRHSLTLTRVVNGPIQARQELEKTYERIQKARQEFPQDAARFYLDST